MRRRDLLQYAALTAAGTGLSARGSAKASRADDSHEADVLVQRVTEPPRHHFFGYYEKSPWNGTGRYLLAHQSGFIGRQPEAGETLTLGTIDLLDHHAFTPVAQTKAWCWQQGAMLQWLGSSPDDTVVYNVIDGDSYASVRHNLTTGAKVTLPRPIYGLSPDGRHAVSLDFSRLGRLRAGYGYTTLPEPDADVQAPDDMGIYSLDPQTGDDGLILSLAWAADNERDSRMKDAYHWFNHLQWNRGGTRFAFLHRWRPSSRKGGWFTRLYCAKPDGTEATLLSDVGYVSHFDWLGDDHVVAHSRQSADGPKIFLKYPIDGGDPEPFAVHRIREDGHNSFSPDRQWMLFDTYPDADRMQGLFALRLRDMKVFPIGRFREAPALIRQPYRCDLHPRWDRTGTKVCIDSSHETHDGRPTRQMYLLDVTPIVRQA